MKKRFFLPIFLLALSLSLPSVSAESPMETAEERLPMSYKNLSQGKYIGGGVASIFLGWGIGHAIQGRYAERGWIFTAGGALATVGVFGFIGKKAGDVLSGENKSLEEATADVSLSGADYAFLAAMLVGSGIRIWEMIDVWMLPSDYKVVKESPFEIKPLAFYDINTNFNYGLSLKYKF